MEELVIKPCIKCGGAERYKSGDCKACARAMSKNWHSKNVEKSKQKCKDYFQNNKGKYNERNKAWIKANPEYVKEYQQRDYVIAARKEWLENNPEKARESADNWKEANSIELRIYQQNARCKSLGVSGKLTLGLIGKLFGLQKGMCPSCQNALGEDFHSDHVVSINKGGLNTNDNMQLLCAPCNARKRNKDPLEFMQEMGFLL
jgi:5-methylcytosine-specific restriction endonuclease McrA